MDAVEAKREREREREREVNKRQTHTHTRAHAIHSRRADTEESPVITLLFTEVGEHESCERCTDTLPSGP